MPPAGLASPSFRLPFFAGVLAGLLLIAFLGQSLASSVHDANMHLVKDLLRSLHRFHQRSLLKVFCRFEKQLTQTTVEAHSPEDVHPQEDVHLNDIQRSQIGSLRPNSGDDDLSEIDEELTATDDSVSHLVRFVYDDREVQEGHLRIEFEQGARGVSLSFGIFHRRLIMCPALRWRTRLPANLSSSHSWFIDLERELKLVDQAQLKLLHYSRLPIRLLLHAVLHETLLLRRYRVE